MADVTGPISTLPGYLYPTPEGMKCDNHPDRLAVKRVQGETDSFGCEMWDLCAECYEEAKQWRNAEREGICDWCKAEVNDLRNKRDYDEGLCGPVYRVCCACAKKYDDQVKEEYDEACKNDDYDEI